MLSSFSCASWPSVCLPWRNVCLDLLPIFWLKLFVFLILSFMKCLYILEINLLLVVSFPTKYFQWGNIFSHSVGCLFVLFMVSFTVQKLLSLIRSYLFIFVFIFITLGGGSKKILLWFMSECLPMFSSRSFIVSSLTFRPVISFEFSFVYSVKRMKLEHSLSVADEFSQHHLLKRLSFLYCIFLPSL